MRDRLLLVFSLAFVFLYLLIAPSQSEPQSSSTSSRASDLDLTPEVERSPVLQRWRRQVPDILEDIRNDPSFRTRLRLGYSYFPSNNQASGINLGVEDIFIGDRLTISGEYQAAFNGANTIYGADLRYYLRPLGSYINFTPIVGYRHLEVDEHSTDGIHLGAKLLLVLSRNGAADIALTQSWVSPGTEAETGLTTLSVGYALTQNLRISTDVQKQNSHASKDSRVGIVFEWMP